MSFLETLRETPLSFRKVRVLWTSTSQKGGFNNDKNTYPNLEGWDVEQISQIPESFSIEGKLLGEDYNKQRALLEGALKTPGPGELVLPGLGAVDVLVASWSIEERLDKMGMARVSISFDCPRQKDKSLLPASPVKVDYGEECRLSLTRVLEETLDLSSEGLYQEFKTALEGTFQELESLVSLIQGKSGPLYSVFLKIEQAVAKLESLATKPKELVKALFDIMDDLTALVAVSKSIAMSDPVRSALLGLRRAVGFFMDPGRPEEGGEPLPVSNTQILEKSYKYLAYYGFTTLLESFTPLSKEDAADQVKALTKLFQAVEGEDPYVNKLLSSMRVQGIKGLYQKILDLGLEGEKLQLLPQGENILALGQKWGLLPSLLWQLNRPANAFFLRGMTRYV